jgi:hypothetical protein
MTTIFLHMKVSIDPFSHLKALLCVPQYHKASLVTCDQSTHFYSQLEGLTNRMVSDSRRNFDTRYCLFALVLIWQGAVHYGRFRSKA